MRSIASINIHLVPGEDGCRYAKEHGCVAVIVDALRASATAAMLLHAGARELFVTREVDEALALRQEIPNAVLYGERGGLPPNGFDGGNSPRDLPDLRGRSVIFTTTTGANRLVAAWGASAVLMASTVNASAVIGFMLFARKDVVLIPAGLTDAPDFPAEEDWAAAAWIAMMSRLPIGEGKEKYRFWSERVRQEGLERLFLASAHADKLRSVGLEKDILYCAQVDITRSLPMAVKPRGPAILCADIKNFAERGLGLLHG